ncbi:ABC transporter permease [Aerococcaceae bacterium NML210727]|nr:ABC transporter permease [Aerococcaceae bacterium NML210727]MCW6655119.1 ABC transporter permease [Aerococcaceae bacterium NML201296]MCW6663759.1 ABC transporter permease [Aerococcaceae bacterium NML190073]
MQLIEILKSSLFTLRTNGRRTFLTMIGIIIGIAAVITIMSLGNGFRKQTLEEFAKDEHGRRSQMFYFNQSNYEKDPMKIVPYKQKDIEAIEAMEGVDEAKLGEQELQETTHLTSNHRGKANTYATKVAEFTDYQMVAGRNLTQMDSENKQRYVVIDVAMAIELFGSEQAALQRSLTLDHQEYTIVGVFVPAPPEESGGFGFGFGLNNAQAAIPKGTFDRNNPLRFPSPTLTVYFKESADMQTLSKRISQYLKENGSAKDDGSYEYFDQTEFMNQIGEQLKIITYFVSSVAGISLFIAGVGVMNMMYISVSERTKEIGIRRSLGATQSSIQTQFLLEGIVITTIGGIIGYLSGIGLAFAISGFLPFNAAVDLPTALMSVLISVVIGIIFSVFPAKAAARKNVVEILR